MNQQVCRFNKCKRKGTVLKLVTNYGLSGLCCVPMAAAVPVEGKKRAMLAQPSVAIRNINLCLN